MKVFIVLLLASVVAGQDYDIDCDNVNPEAKKFVDEGIPSALVFMISKTTCPYCTRAKQTLKDIGFHEDDLNIVELDDFDADFKSDIQDYNWCVTGGRTFPRVWANKQVVGGADNTKEGYYSGKLISLAYEARLKRAAKEFVDTAVEKSGDNTYLLISKKGCPFCVMAEMCLKRMLIPANRMRVHDIKEWDTHDQIKEYAGELTGASSTPRIWLNKKLIGGYTELKQFMGC